MKINKHFLEDGKIEKKLTPNLYDHKEFRMDDYPDSIVLHYTAMESAELAVKALTNKNVKASAHLVISRDSECTVHQLAPFNYRTWHAGKSHFNNRSGYNNFSIGIEIDNLGWLKEYTGFYSRPELIKPHRDPEVQVLPEDVLEASHKNPNVSFRFWHKFKQLQVEKVIEICRMLVDQYDIKEIVGHDDIAPTRKQDPGPAFPLEYVVKQVFGLDRSDDTDEAQTVDAFEGRVSASKLNIRTGPDMAAEKVAKPLARDSKVTVIAQQGEWYRVKTEVEGWVYSKYII